MTRAPGDGVRALVLGAIALAYAILAAFYNAWLWMIVVFLVICWTAAHYILKQRTRR